MTDKTEPDEEAHDGTALGAHALGMLDGAAADVVERHVAACAPCRREWEGLREMSDLLGEMPPEVFLDGPAPDGELLAARTVAQVRDEVAAAGATRRRRRLLGAAAAAVIAVAAAVGGGILLGRTLGPPTVLAAGTVTIEGSGDGGARLRADVSPAADWVRLGVTVSGVPKGEHCRLLVVRKDGRREIAGSWTVGPRGEANGVTIDGAADVPLAEVAAVAVEGPDGRVYVSAPA